jgi:hypothetical protein
MKSVFLKFAPLIALLTFSCSDTDNEIVNSPDIPDLESKIGEFHNIALDLYTIESKNFSDYKDLREILVDELTNNHPDIFNVDQLNVELNEIDNLTTKVGLNQLGRVLSISVYDDFTKIVSYLKNNSLISQKLSTTLESVNERIELNPKDSEANLSLVNDLLNNDWDSEDLKYVSVFVDVYNHSYSYWNSGENSSNGSGRILADGDDVILADAAGALYGLLCGAPWSIIEGALFSIIANNQVK